MVHKRKYMPDTYDNKGVIHWVCFFVSKKNKWLRNESNWKINNLENGRFCYELFMLLFLFYVEQECEKFVITSRMLHWDGLENWHKNIKCLFFKVNY